MGSKPKNEKWRLRNLFTLPFVLKHIGYLPLSFLMSAYAISAAVGMVAIHNRQRASRTTTFPRLLAAALSTMDKASRAENRGKSALNTQ
eukprot:1100780-Rhodomonas_salina.1